MATATQDKPAVKEPHPDMDPAGYLLAKGWKPQGDPRKPECLWLDPTKPLTPKMERVKVGEKKVGLKTEDVFQGIYHPAAWPFPTGEAVSIQRARGGE